jgi:hypothetical protein
MQHSSSSAPVPTPKSHHVWQTLREAVARQRLKEQIAYALAAFGIILFIVVGSLLPTTNPSLSKIQPKENASAASLKKFGDLNNDSHVNVFDLSILVRSWLSGDNEGDVNGDGKVNVFDLSALSANWGKAFNPTVSNPPPTSTPTPTTASQPTANPTSHPTNHPGTVVASDNSMALGKWTPNPKFDTCTKDQHETYKVQGPDGKWYPTWHPPLGPSSCKFGHDHGRNPTGYQYWAEIQSHYAYDADKNGSMSQAELAAAGIPFGLVNEQLDAYNATKGLSWTRHEDHVGHKVEYANGEGDIGEGTDPFDTNTTGGIVVPIAPGTGGKKWDPSGIRCYHFHKIHQGVSTPDALTNNLHEALLHQKCTSTRTDFPASTSILSGMIAFGAPGGFNSFCTPLRDQIIFLGTNDINKNFPGTANNGSRVITPRDCMEQQMLVTSGQFSGFPYEIWSGDVAIRTATGKHLASNGGSWEVLDVIRYYDPQSSTKIAYTTPLCYLQIGDRRARGGTCDAMTNYGQIKDITWDDPRSGFRGLHRGQYIDSHRLSNQGGPTYWYSDPLGHNAQTTPFPGSIRQLISPVNASKIGLFGSDPRIIQRRHNSGSNSVHAPN